MFHNFTFHNFTTGICEDIEVIGSLPVQLFCKVSERSHVLAVDVTIFDLSKKTQKIFWLF